MMRVARCQRSHRRRRARTRWKMRGGPTAASCRDSLPSVSAGRSHVQARLRRWHEPVVELRGRAHDRVKAGDSRPHSARTRPQRRKHSDEHSHAPTLRHSTTHTHTHTRARTRTHTHTLSRTRASSPHPPSAPPLQPSVRRSLSAHVWALVRRWGGSTSGDRNAVVDRCMRCVACRALLGCGHARRAGHSLVPDGRRSVSVCLAPAHICAGTGLTPAHICAGTRRWTIYPGEGLVTLNLLVMALQLGDEVPARRRDDQYPYHDYRYPYRDYQYPYRDFQYS